MAALCGHSLEPFFKALNPKAGVRKPTNKHDGCQRRVHLTPPRKIIQNALQNAKNASRQRGTLGEMKTSERILVTATQLFNERGERNVTASDIALELDISPGNLYYHFKGKDAILGALFQGYYRELAGILATPILESSFLDDEDLLERSWLFLTVLLEAMYEKRFLYFNQSDLMQRYPDVDRGMRRLMSLKRQAAGQLATALLAPVDISAHPQRLHHVSDSMALTLMYWLNFEQLSASTLSRQQTLHRAVLQVLSHCAPYLGDKEADFYRECELIDARLLDSHSQ